MDALEAARRWAETWERAWPDHDVDSIAALYAADGSYRSYAFRDATTADRYLPETFAAEADVECRFGDPIAAGDRAAVEWWASWVEDGRTLTMAGTSVLRFDADGQVVDQRDYWNETDGRLPPYDGWL
jgi:hypothetical protein